MTKYKSAEAFQAADVHYIKVWRYPQIKFTFTFKEVPTARKKVIQLFYSDLNILSYEPKLLVILLLKTEDGELIKYFLNHEFQIYRTDEWTRYDSALVVNYLIQRNFQHTEIKGCLLNEPRELNKVSVNFP